MNHIKIMSSYPDELTFGAKSLSGFSKNTVKLSTQTLLDALPGDQIIFELPSNQLVDLRTFAVHYDLVGTVTTANKHCVLPRDTNSYIDSVTVEVNGSVIDGSCSGYAHLAKIFTDFAAEHKETARSVLNLTRDWPADGSAGASALARIGYSAATTTGLAGQASGAVAIVNDPRGTQNAYAAAWNNFQGFLGCGKIIDTSICGTIKVIIKTMPGTIVSGDTSASYVLKNLRAYVDVLDVADGTYYKMVNSVLEQGTISIPFKKFYSFYFPELTSSGALRASIATQSLDAAYLIFLTKYSDTAYKTTYPTTANATAPAFKRNTGGAAGLTNVQFDVSSCLYPQFTVTPFDAYYLLQKTMGTLYADGTSSLNELTIRTWVDDFFVAAYRWNYGPGVDVPRSGIDSRGISLPISCNINAGGAVGMPLMFAESTATMTIGKYRSVSIVN
jgi:hypothetical protein